MPGIARVVTRHPPFSGYLFLCFFFFPMFLSQKITTQNQNHSYCTHTCYFKNQWNFHRRLDSICLFGRLFFLSMLRTQIFFYRLCNPFYEKFLWHNLKIDTFFSFISGSVSCLHHYLIVLTFM